MIQRILDQPWAFLGFIVVLVFLYVGAAIRVGHDRKLKRRAVAERRQKPRPGKDRRWSDRRRKK